MKWFIKDGDSWIELKNGHIDYGTLSYWFWLLLFYRISVRKEI